MVEPYDLQQIDTYSSIDEFSSPLIDKYSQSLSFQTNFGINLSNKSHFFPIFICFNGHTKLIDTINFINNLEVIKEINEIGYKEIDINSDLINNISDLKQYINLYNFSKLYPSKIIISKSISYNPDKFFSEIINDNGFINNTIDIYSLINDLNIIQKTNVLKKVDISKFKITNEISNSIIYNKEFKYTFIYNIEDNKKIDIGNWNEFEVVYSSDYPIISRQILEQYDRKFWNNFLLSYHTTILEEMETTNNDTISFKHNLDTIIRNMFITNKDTNLENENRSYSIEEIYLRIRDRLDNDYGFSTYFIIKLIEEYLIEFKQDDGKYKGLIDRYDYQINNNLEADYKERSKLYLPL